MGALGAWVRDGVVSAQAALVCAVALGAAVARGALVRAGALGAVAARVLALAGMLVYVARAAGPLPDLGVLDGGARANSGFAQVRGPRTFEFPRDHGPHPEYRQEWWYITGNLDAANGERFGFELTFFRFALAPPPATGSEAKADAGAKSEGARTKASATGAAGAGATATGPAGTGVTGAGASAIGAAGTGATGAGATAIGAPRAEATGTGAAGAGGAKSAGAGFESTAAGDAVSRWRAREIYMAHFAITDVARQRFRFSQKLSRGAVGLAGAEIPPLRVWVDDWSLAATSATGAPDDTQWHLRAAQNGYELTLDAQALLQPVLNGDQGFSRKSSAPGAASYYYSIPRVAVHGQLLRDGKPLDVRGLAWVDREWGSGPLDRGWDWFALQMNDGSSLMFYALRSDDGRRDPNSAGTWTSATGQSRKLSGEEVQIDVLDYWTNPRGERYPSRWRVRVPTVGIDVEVRPVLQNQELTTSTRYWEGAVDVSAANPGGDQKPEGRGYVELVGYAAQ